MWEIIPNPGRIKIYTSGCPKNQNKCWYRIGSPPPLGSKNDVLKFRSVKSIVIAPANTGKANSNKNVVISTLHANKGTCSNHIVLGRIFRIVIIKFNELMIEDAPARCKDKIAKSTDAPEWEIWFDRGGYTVQPVPLPWALNIEEMRRVKEEINNQNLILFIRGNAISGVVIISGINQLPNPPIITGMTIKKIMMKAWAVTIEL